MAAAFRTGSSPICNALGRGRHPSQPDRFVRIAFQIRDMRPLSWKDFGVETSDRARGSCRTIRSQTLLDSH